jgi:amino acid adenylation domain-containing protein
MRHMMDDIPQRGAEKPIEASFAQERLYFMEKLAPGSCIFNMLNGFSIRGELDRGVMEKAIGEVVRRHEVLRTNLVQAHGRVWQVISESTGSAMDFVDLSYLPEVESTAEAKRLAIGWVQKSYDLSKDRLFRTVLMKISRDRHLLAILSHHTVLDGWSLGVFASELVSIYASFVEGKPSPLSELTAQYRDYSVQQRERYNAGEFEKEWEYWKGRLGTDLQVLELQTDKPRGGETTHRGDMVILTIPCGVRDKLKLLGMRHGCTLYMTLLAAFYVFLYKYSGSSDLVVGCPVAGRRSNELEGLMGLFINTLPVRAELSGTMSFTRLLKKIRRLCIDTYDNQGIPFEKIIERLAPERSLSHSPVYQVLFQLKNFPTAGKRGNPIDLEAFEFGWVTAKVDLTMDMLESEEGIGCELEYSTELFERGTAERMAKAWAKLLQGIADSEDMEISRLQLFPPDELHWLVVERNRTRTEYPRDKCVHQIFEGAASMAPDAIAITHGRTSLTYGDLNERANKLSRHLSGLGVLAGDLVGVCLDRSIDMVIALLAILKAGGVYVPLEPNHPPERMESIFRDITSRAVITVGRYAGRMPLGATRVCLDNEAAEIQGRPGGNACNHVDSGSAACVIYTSGSLGMPKGVYCSHRGVVRVAVNTNYIEIKPGDTVVHASSPVFDATTFEIWGALLNGARVLIVDKEILLSNDGCTELLRRERATVMFITTALFNLKAREAPSTFGSLRTLMFGGEVADPTSVKRVLELGRPRRLLHMYGPTENSVFSTFYEVFQVAEGVHSIPIGGNVSNSSSYILDGDLQPVPIGVKGEIFLSGDGVALGYIGQPDLTRSYFLPNPFEPGRTLYKTGDLAKFLPNGNIEFLGREDLQVKIRGFRVELGEIEAALTSHPSVKAAAVMVEEDGEGKEKCLVAYVLPGSGVVVKPEELRAFMTRRLPNYMVPRSFVFIESMPLTPTGKIDRRRLPKPAVGRVEVETAGGLMDDTESKLAIIFGRVLGAGAVGREDDFFELGGHSLLAVRLCSAIEHEFRVSLPVATLFRAPSVGLLARELKLREPRGMGSLIPIRATGSRPKLFLVHSGDGEVRGYMRLVKALGEEQPVYGLRAEGLGEDMRLPTTVEEVASGYIREMRGVQSSGPYHIVGWCIGGVVAFEIAQQLMAQGEEVGLMGILNYEAPNRQKWRSRRSAMRGALAEAYYLGGDLLRYGKLKRRGMGLNLPSRALRLERLAMRGIGIFQSREVELPGESFTALPETWQRVMINLSSIVGRYEPRRYGGVITVFRQELNPFFSSRDPADGWDRLAAGGIVVINTKGRRHVDMLEPPEARNTARTIMKLIDWHEEQARRKIAGRVETAVNRDRPSANAFERVR